MKHLTIRLKSGDLLKESIEKLAIDKKIAAGVLLSMVGGVENAVLRMARSTPQDQAVKKWDEPLEIVSATGTISMDGCHIHASLSDHHGNVFGGHLKDGCKVKYTVELVIGILDDTTYRRVMDEQTGFKELVVE